MSWQFFHQYCDQSMLIFQCFSNLHISKYPKPFLNTSLMSDGLSLHGFLGPSSKCSCYCSKHHLMQMISNFDLFLIVHAGKRDSLFFYYSNHFTFSQFSIHLTRPHACFALMSSIILN